MQETMNEKKEAEAKDRAEQGRRCSYQENRQFSFRPTIPTFNVQIIYWLINKFNRLTLSGLVWKLGNKLQPTKFTDLLCLGRRH